MSHLTNRKTRLVFTTADLVRERRKLREVVMEAHTHYVDVRLAGLRRSFPISYATIYQVAAKIAADRQRAEKRESRRNR